MGAILPCSICSSILGKSFLSKTGTLNSSGLTIRSTLTKWSLSTSPYHTAGKTIKLKIEQETGCFPVKFIYGTSLMGHRLQQAANMLAIVVKDQRTDDR